MGIFVLINLTPFIPFWQALYVYVCILHMYASKHRWIQAIAHVWRSKGSLGCFFWLPTLVETDLWFFGYVYEASWSVGFWVLCCFCLPSPHKSAGIAASGIWTQVLKRAWHMLYPLNRLSYSFLDKFLGSNTTSPLVVFLPRSFNFVSYLEDKPSTANFRQQQFVIT